MMKARLAKLVALSVFLAAGVTVGIVGAGQVKAQDAFLGAKGSATAPAPSETPPYRPGTAPAKADAPARPTPAAAATASGNLDLLDRGEFAAASGKFAEAERLWRQALEQNPNWGTVKQRLAELPSRRAGYAGDLAQQEQRRQARLDLVEGVSYFNEHDYPAAAHRFQSYLAVFPEDAEIRGYLDLALGRGASLGGGTLRVACEPKAEVLLDGRLVGRTPLTLPQVVKGDHVVEVRANGGSQSKSLHIDGGETVEVSFRLLGGFLSVNADPWAEVLLDGQPMGQTPVTLENLILGQHLVEVRHPNLPEQARQVFLEAGQTQALHFNLTPQ